MITGIILALLTIVSLIVLAVLVIMGVTMLVAMVTAGTFVFILPLIDVLIGIGFVVLGIWIIARRHNKKK